MNVSRRVNFVCGCHLPLGSAPPLPFLPAYLLQNETHFKLKFTFGGQITTIQSWMNTKQNIFYY